MSVQQRQGVDRPVRGENERNPAKRTQPHNERQGMKASSAAPMGKVKRWRAGQLPDWAQECEHDGYLTTSEAHERSSSKQLQSHSPQGVAQVVEHAQHASDRVAKSATEQLAEQLKANEAAAATDAEQRRRLAREREGTQQAEEEGDEDELADLPVDEGMLEQIRHQHIGAASAAQYDAKAFRARSEDEDKEEVVEKENGDEDEDEEDDDDESDDEDDTKLARPVFVPRGKRSTEEERARVQQEAEDAEKREEERRERLRQQSKQLIEQERDALAQEADEAEKITSTEAAARESDIDTDDEKDVDEEYEQWKVRELDRLRREKIAREGKQEDEETQRMRQLTDEERNEEAAKRAQQPGTQRSRSKTKFMQRYYHKGAFFQSDADELGGTAGTHEIIHKRDFSEATGEDRVDKTMLPQPMQVRKGNFGLKGQTKWTHLTKEDTTLKARENSLAAEQQSIAPGRQKRWQQAMAGMKADALEKPRASKRRKRAEQSQ